MLPHTYHFCTTVRDLNESVSFLSALFQFTAAYQCYGHYHKIGEVNFKFLSLNVHGFRDNHERKSVFAWIEKQKGDIIFLQET